MNAVRLDNKHMQKLKTINTLAACAVFCALLGACTATDDRIPDATDANSLASDRGYAPRTPVNLTEEETVVTPAKSVSSERKQGYGAGEIHPYVESSNANTASRTAVTPGQEPEYYTVQRGDTLYSIAFRFNQDYHTLAANNGISAPYSIEAGQRLRIRAAASQAKNAARGRRTYVVQPGDTVNSVSRAYGVSVNSIVAANKLSAPYHLKRGETIIIPAKDEGDSVRRTTTTTASGTTISRTVVTQKSEPAPAPQEADDEVSTTTAVTEVISGKTRKVGGITWMWPAKGTVVRNFSSSSNGIDIAGSRGQNVLASADGQVVYAGSALRGYGNLIIINHNSQYLSAYAHNDTLRVTEGQKVKRGQVIASMGSTDADRVKLHFEVREKGKSVNPTRFLPK